MIRAALGLGAVVFLITHFSARAASPGCADALSVDHMRTLQLGKHRVRTLSEYDAYLFGSIDRHRPLRAIMTDVAESGAPPRGLTEFLGGLAVHATGPLRWCDVGAGYAIAFRQLTRDHSALAERLELSAVDLFDRDREGDFGQEMQARHDAGTGILDPALKPKYILGDLAHVTPRDQHLITSVETIQYVGDKLETIARLYDQLAPGGLLLIVAEHNWSRELAFDLPRQPDDQSIMHALLVHLHRHGIPVAFAGESSHVLHTLALRKIAGTHLRPLHPATRSWTSRHGFRWSYYPVPPGQSALEVLGSSKMNDDEMTAK